MTSMAAIHDASMVPIFDADDALPDAESTQATTRHQGGATEHFYIGDHEGASPAQQSPARVSKAKASESPDFKKQAQTEETDTGEKPKPAPSASSQERKAASAASRGN